MTNRLEGSHKIPGIDFFTKQLKQNPPPRPHNWEELYPTSSRLEGVAGESVFDLILLIANYYLDRKITRTVMAEDGTYQVEYYVPSFVLIGPPGNGKTTIRRELNILFEELGYLIETNITYEDELKIQHGLHGKPGEDFSAKTFYETNLGLYRRLSRGYIIDKYKKGQKPHRYPFANIVRLSEVPVVSELLPHEQDLYQLLGAQHRDRGTEAMVLLNTETKTTNTRTPPTVNYQPIYFIPLTGDVAGRLEVINHREALLKLESEGPDMINSYLWKNDLLPRNLKIDPIVLIELIKHMARRNNLDKIESEITRHENVILEKIGGRFGQVLTYRQSMLGEPITEAAALTLLETITLDYYLLHCKIPPNRIINAINKYQNSLKSTFFKGLANQS